jgi:hypothetical protein
MRKNGLAAFLLLVIQAICFNSVAQDFSNKGKEFWVGYGYHVYTNTTNSQQMVFYFAADQNSNVTITIPALAYSQTLYVPAGQVVTSAPMPKTGAQDARLTAQGLSNKGIRIQSDKPIVAYAHIYNSSVSGATILYPTNTLGKEYYSINFTQVSNDNNSNCWFYVVATDTGTTTVDITPSAATMNPGWTPGQTQQITLTQGQVYNVMGTTTGGNGTDLTGSVVKSINTGTGCKRIAVFSGSGKLSIRCGGTQPNSADNYIAQAVPRAAWGKKYLTVGTAPNMINGYYRICVSDTTTVVNWDGVPITVPLTNNFYYQIGPVSGEHMVTADKPVMVAQYITTQFWHCSALDQRRHSQYRNGYLVLPARWDFFAALRLQYSPAGSKLFVCTHFDHGRAAPDSIGFRVQRHSVWLWTSRVVWVQCRNQYKGPVPVREHKEPIRYCQFSGHLPKYSVQFGNGISVPAHADPMDLWGSAEWHGTKRYYTRESRVRFILGGFRPDDLPLSIATNLYCSNGRNLSHPGDRHQSDPGWLWKHAGDRFRHGGLPATYCQFHLYYKRLLQLSGQLFR